MQGRTKEIQDLGQDYANLHIIFLFEVLGEPGDLITLRSLPKGGRDRLEIRIKLG